MLKKRSIAIALIAGLAAAPFATAEVHGDRYGRYRAPIPSVASDLTVEARVHAELENALGRRADEIEVEVVNGVVILDGWVPTEAERRIAHDAVYDASGVRGLRMNELRARTYNYN